MDHFELKPGVNAPVSFAELASSETDQRFNQPEEPCMPPIKAVSFAELAEIEPPIISDDTISKSYKDESVHFWDLAEEPHRKQLEGETAGQYLARLNDPSKWLYGSEMRDHMFLKAECSIPRYGHLARKAFIHYAGEHYNPHTISYMNERFVREIIKNVIEYKVQGKVKDYDWTYIDSFFPKMIGDLLDLDIPYDKVRLKQGLKPEFRSPYHGLELLPPN